MSQAKFNEETRNRIESIFAANPDKYGTPEKQLKFLEIQERQKYNYYCDCTNYGYFGKWKQEEINDFESAWNEILFMIEERKALL